MANDYLDINLKVDGETLSFRVDRNGDEEVAYRESAKELESYLIAFRKEYGASTFSKETQLKYITLALLKDIYLREKQNDIIIERIDKLAEDVSKATSEL